MKPAIVLVFAVALLALLTPAYAAKGQAGSKLLKKVGTPIRNLVNKAFGIDPKKIRSQYRQFAREVKASGGRNPKNVAALAKSHQDRIDGVTRSIKDTFGRHLAGLQAQVKNVGTAQTALQKQISSLQKSKRTAENDPKLKGVRLFHNAQIKKVQGTLDHLSARRSDLDKEIAAAKSQRSSNIDSQAKRITQEFDNEVQKLPALSKADRKAAFRQSNRQSRSFNPLNLFRKKAENK